MTDHLIPIPNDLDLVLDLIFQPLGLSIHNLVIENESKEYNAYQFEVDNLKFLYRKSKTTPTKKGQFVTLWKRSLSGPIAPFDKTDGIDFVILFSETSCKSGFFIFSKEILFSQAIFSTDKKEGKRGFRIYLPWEQPDSKQALKTQQWQKPFFVENETKDLLNTKQIQKLIK